MPSPTPTHSTRLENLRLGAQGAAFALDGRPVQLAAETYAAPVAALQAFQQLALADYQARAAELSRLAAAEKPSVLRRVLSWVGGFMGRLIPGQASATAPRDHRPLGPATVAPSAETAVPPDPTPPLPAKSIARRPEASLPVAAEAAAAGPSAPAGAGAGRQAAPPPPLPAPLLHVAFADREGVHVIWQLAAIRPDPSRRREAADGKNAPRLELTYGLDSEMGRGLQACYGQLAQLGYKIAGLESVRPAPAKPAAEKGAKVRPTDAVIILPPPAPLESGPATEKDKPMEAKAAGRKTRAEAGTPRPEPPTPLPEGTAAAPGLLPGL